MENIEGIKIQFIDFQGLPFDGESLEKTGLGGSEQAIVHMSRELQALGCQVYVYNNTPVEGEFGDIIYRKNTNIDFDIEYDVVISERTTYPFADIKWRDEIKKDSLEMSHGKLEVDIEPFQKLKCKKKIIHAHDYTLWGEFQFNEMTITDGYDEIFLLSDFHQVEYIKKTSTEKLLDKIWITRNGVNFRDYNIDVFAKDPNMFITNYSISKGIPLALELWQGIKEQIGNPDLRLHVIGGYYPFPDKAMGSQEEMEKLREQYRHDESIIFEGFIPQEKVFQLYEKQSYMLYPCTFPETYGISTIEQILHNVVSFCVDFGSLKEVSQDCMYILPNNTNSYPDWNSEYKKQFIEMVVHGYKNRFVTDSKRHKMNELKKFLFWKTIQLQWKQHLYNILNIPLNPLVDNKINYINNRVKWFFNSRILNPEDTIEYFPDKERRIVIVSPVRNAEQYIANNMFSVANQHYTNYRHIIIDDCSTDKTTKVIEEVLNVLPENRSEKIVFIRNDIRKYALKNQYEQIKKYCESGDIIVLLDGDDWLLNDSEILKYINNEYDFNNYKMTYGSSIGVGSNLEYNAQEYPTFIKQNRDYRNYRFEWVIPMTHLRTFEYDLFVKIPKQYFLDNNGEFYTIQSDVAMMYPMLEICDPKEIGVINRHLMAYNDENELNDYKTQGEFQNKIRDEIINKPKVSVTIEELPKKETDVTESSSPDSIDYNQEKTLDLKYTKDFNIKNPVNIMIATPTNKQLENETSMSLQNMTKPSGVFTHYGCYYAYSIQQMRNLIVKNAINSNLFDYIFWVDSDIQFPKDTLVKFLDSNKPFISGLYRQRKDEIIPEVYYRTPNGNLVPYDLDVIQSWKGIREVDAIGFGCVLTDVNLFKSYEFPWFVYHETYEFANTLSEDIDGCNKIYEQTKIKPHLDPTIKCIHIGKKYFKV